MNETFAFSNALIRKPLTMIAQFFCDEGGKYQSGKLVSFVGLIASPPRLKDFDEEWKATLHSYELPAFHMMELADVHSAHGPKFPRDRTGPQTIEALEPFADCINKHLEVGLIQVWSVNAYVSMPTEAKARLGGSCNDPHYLAFIRGVLEAVNWIEAVDRLSVVCDDDKAKAWDFYLHYRAICDAVPELRKKLVALTFAQDENFPALQAADMVAFLSRKEALAEFQSKTSDWTPLFSYLTTDPEPSKGFMSWYRIFAGEKELLALANSLDKPLAGEKPSQRQKEKRASPDSSNAR
ncbi:MAG TPA: hypothetical protein VGS20_07510 [Candidatus Acidoferrales bacterium]|nr:hypothetical protein [Candidatus Acidoferrales bacterium]